MPLKDSRNDRELVEKLNKGDLDAFDAIFKRYSDRLFGFTIGYLKSKEDSEGLVQDVFLKIWENRKNIKKEASLKSYLFTIAYHDMCRIFRKRKIHLKLLEESVSDNNLVFNPENQMEYKAKLEQIELLLEKLPEKQKQIFIKSRNEGKSTKEIAREMKLAPGTVDNNISATLKFLKKHISRDNLALLLFFAIFIQ